MVIKNLQVLKDIWNHIYNPNKEVITVIEKYFHPEYEQCINGLVVSRTQYIDHVIEQRKSMKIALIRKRNATHHPTPRNRYEALNIQ